jgi:hypothetical protein
MPEKTPARLVAEEMCRKFPEYKDRTLARALVVQYPQLFHDIEHARSVVRLAVGHSGEHNRKKSADKSLYKPMTYERLPFIPKEYNDPPKVWRLPKNLTNCGIINDLHIPYHDTVATDAALNRLVKDGIDSLFINGDLPDFYPISDHEKDARKRPSIDEEIDMTAGFLAGLKKHLNVPIFYKPGNHEHRLERFIAKRMPEFARLKGLTLEEQLNLKDSGIDFIPRRDITYMGDLMIEHGDRMKGAGGMSPAHTLFKKYKRHVVCGHFHRESETISRIFDGPPIKTASIGCLCHILAEYMELNEWVHGFARVEVDHSSNDFVFKNFTIEAGKIY